MSKIDAITGVEGSVNAYCLFCRTGCERNVLGYLHGLRGVEAYFPVRQLRELHGREWRLVERALLPGYVFVFGAEEDEPKLRAHPDVLRILEYADTQRALVGADFAFAQWVRNNRGSVSVSQARKENQRVVIISGPLADYRGKIVHIEARKQRALVEMEFGGKIQRVSLSFEYVGSKNRR